MPEQTWSFLWGVLFCVNLLGFALMGADKRRAKRERWRIRERTLFLPALLGGAAGCFLGMRVFHHKTRHWYFRYGLPLLTLAQLAALVWAAIRFSA